MTKQEEIREIRQGLKEISEGKVVPLNVLEKRQEIREGIKKRLCQFCWSIAQDEEADFIYANWEECYGDKCCERCEDTAEEILKDEDSLGVVIRVDRELPKKLTNNIGCMSRGQIEDFTTMVLKKCDYPHKMEWTTAGDILIGEVIYIDERHIDEYPYMAKERVLHEIAHIDTHPQDNRHGELFHRRLAELINRFMAGYVATEPLVEKK